jgi:uncharacterized protein
MRSVSFQRMFTLVAAALLLTAAFALDAAESMPLLGDWEGAIETPAGDMPVYLHVTRSKEGNVGGSIDSPDQGAMGLPISGVSLTESVVRFEVKSVNGKYEGKANGDWTAINGTWNGVMGAMPLKFHRPTQK